MLLSHGLSGVRGKLEVIRLIKCYSGDIYDSFILDFMYLYTHSSVLFCMEIGISDSPGTKRHLLSDSSVDDTEVKLHSKKPKTREGESAGSRNSSPSLGPVDAATFGSPRTTVRKEGFISVIRVTRVY